MSLISVVQSVCPMIGVMTPTSVFSNLPASRTQQELLAVANEMAQRIAYETRDWQELTATQVFTGDGVKTAFPLPVNYQRMLTKANIYRSTAPQYPMQMIADPDVWTQRKLQNYWYFAGQWILLGGALNIEPPLSSGETATFAYLDNRCINLTSGGRGTEFQNDTDTFVLSERLLKLGMIWQWKAYKGSPYAEDMGTYSDALATLMGHNQPAPIIIGGQTPSSMLDVSTALPGVTFYLPRTPTFP